MYIKLTAEQKKANSIARKEARETANREARIKEEKDQKPVKELTISIEWKKSRMWGSNPHATAKVSFQDGSFERREGFTCSGCGYCKKSTVVSQVFNAFLKYKLWELSDEAIKGGHGSRDNGEAPYGIHAYASGRGFSGGIGTNCYTAISEYIGGKFETLASGKTFDVFRYTDNG